jgi:YbdK family carboxylate-amine ligase
MTTRMIGIEEELLLIDPVTCRPCGASLPVLGQLNQAADDVLDAELQRQQLETRTPPCSSLAELHQGLRRGREVAAAAARGVGVDVAALGTSPHPVQPSPTPSDRYRRMAERFCGFADEQLTCGCHVHVQVDSGDEGVAVLDRIRIWLPILLALSSNSPFWQGHDTGYASFRSLVWGRWPSAGPTETFGSYAEYEAAVSAMLATRTILDRDMIYFDGRLSRKHSTVEVRVCDVSARTEDVVLLAALTRGLVETAAREWRAGRPPPHYRVDLLRLASWRAARYGLTSDLVHPDTRCPAPAAAVAADLVEHVRPALVAAGDLGLAEDLLAALLARGSGAEVQRQIHRQTGDLTAVVAHAMAVTDGRG